MTVYFANNSAFTPSTSMNWILDSSTTSNYARVLEVAWGGELTTTTAMRTRWLRPTTAGTTTFTNVGSIQSGHPGATAGFRFGTTSTQPTVPAAPAALYATSWNAHGGIGRWLAAPGEEWMILGFIASTQQIVCCQDIGVTATSMSAGVGWLED